jgi:hypothetical protein
MSPAKVSGALMESLGARASAELMEVLDSQQRASTETVMTHCEDRFERRLVEETSKLRVDVAQLRGEVHQGFAGIRGEMHQGFADIRGEMHQGFADIRGEIATSRFELLRWSFGFWVAQLVGVAGIVGVLLRSLPAR